MKIVAVIPDGDRPSGVTTYVRTLVAHDADVACLCLDDPSAAGPDVKSVGPRTFALSVDESHRPGAVALAVERVALQLSDPDLVFLPNVGEPSYLGCALAAASLNRAPGYRARLVGIAHSDHVNQYDMLRLYASQCARFLGVSPTIAARLAETLPGRRQDVGTMVYPIAANLGNVRREPRADELRLIYIGRLDEEQKRVSRLAHLASALADRRVRCTLTIVGGGPEEASLRTALAPLAGSCVSVTLVGSQSRDAVAGLLRRHDVCVLVSAYEGQPFALLEAMAGGLCPAVMAMASGIDDLVYDGRTGVVVPQGDVTALADAIQRLGRDRDRIADYGRNAMQLVESRFGVARHLAMLRDTARAAVADAPPPSPRHSSLLTVEPVVRQLLEGLPPDPARLVIFGAGIIGRTLLDGCLAAGRQVVGIVDSDASRVGRAYRDVPAGLPDSLPDFRPDCVLIASAHFVDAIEDRVRAVLAAAKLGAVSIRRAAPAR